LLALVLTEEQKIIMASSNSGNWRKPRMKIYDYNQEFGGNYYQPMIKYIHSKEIQGPYLERQEIYMPDKCEVISNKFSNMRASDKSPLDLELEDFLVRSYKKQIKELNSSTAMARVKMIHAAASVRSQPHSPMDNENTPFDAMRLLRGAPPGRERVQFYASELAIMKKHTDEYHRKRRQHLFNVTSLGEYDYHYKLFQGSADRNYKFHDPELIADYVRKI
jgi:hypothetical protein